MSLQLWAGSAPVMVPFTLETLYIFTCLRKMFSILSSGTCRVLSVWLDHYPGDFDEPPYYPSLHKIINFVKNDVERQQDKSLCVKTEKLLDKLSVSPFACEGMSICLLSSQVFLIHSLVWHGMKEAQLILCLSTVKLY